MAEIFLFVIVIGWHVCTHMEEFARERSLDYQTLLLDVWQGSRILFNFIDDMNHLSLIKGNCTIVLCMLFNLVLTADHGELFNISYPESVFF